MDDTSKIRESLWHWDLSEIDGITNYSVLFSGEKAHLNLQAVNLDAAAAYSAIPEPGTVSLIAGISIEMVGDFQRDSSGFDFRLCGSALGRKSCCCDARRAC